MRFPTDKLKGMKVAEYMATRLVTFDPDMKISEAVGLLMLHKYTGAPVLDAGGKLVGMLSEKDCLKVAVLANAEGAAEALVGDYMTTEVESVAPDTDLLEVA
jgi:CBS domain-containing protein